MDTQESTFQPVLVWRRGNKNPENCWKTISYLPFLGTASFGGSDCACWEYFESKLSCGLCPWLKDCMAIHSTLFFGNSSPLIEQNFEMDHVKLEFIKAFRAFPIPEFHIRIVHNILLPYNIHNFIPVIFKCSKLWSQSRCIRYLVWREAIICSWKRLVLNIWLDVLITLLILLSVLVFGVKIIMHNPQKLKANW